MPEERLLLAIDRALYEHEAATRGLEIATRNLREYYEAIQRREAQREAAEANER